MRTQTTAPSSRRRRRARRHLRLWTSELEGLWRLRGGSRDTLAHYVACRKLRSAIEAVVGMPSRRMPVERWFGIDSKALDMQIAEVVQRVAVACLAYQWSRTKWYADGAPGRVPAGVAWLLELWRVVRKVLATGPLVASGIPRRKRAAERRR